MTRDLAEAICKVCVRAGSMQVTRKSASFYHTCSVRSAGHATMLPILSRLWLRQISFRIHLPLHLAGLDWEFSIGPLSDLTLCKGTPDKSEFRRESDMPGVEGCVQCVSRTLTAFA